MSTVFVSYSHRDGNDGVMTALRPLERQGQLTLWADQKIQPGDDWLREIDEALARATAAVLLISPDFLASNFIVQHELPVLLARAEAGVLKLVPVFLRASVVDTLEIGYIDLRTGESRKVKLSKYQGFGTPSQPLAVRTEAERDQIYADLAAHLVQLSTAVAVPPPAPAPRRTVRSVDPAREYELTVHLERSGDGLQVRTSRPGGAPLADVSRPWGEMGRAAEEIARTLDTANRRVLERKIAEAATGWGVTLFDLLFGLPREWQEILRTLYGRGPTDPQPFPAYGKVRLRVATADRLLAGLPWRLTAWNRQLLTDIGWELFVTDVEDPLEDQTTRPEAEVLIVAPGHADDEGPARAVREVLGKIWPGQESGAVRVATTRAEVEKALRGMRPHLIWWSGRGSVEAGRPGLWLDGAGGREEHLALAELSNLFRERGHQPAALWLDADGLAEPGLPTPGELFPSASLILWRRLPEIGDDLSDLGLAWLRAWLGGLDPIAALHQVCPKKPEPAVATLVAHARYRSWKAPAREEARRKHDPLHSLDRSVQKAIVQRHLRELVDSGTRRVLGLVAWAEEGNQIDSFWQALRYDLERSGDGVDITWKSLQFPSARDNLRRDLEGELRVQLDGDDHEPIRHLLRAQIGRAGRAGRRPVLWLNWGTFGDRFEQAALTKGHLEDWLRFASELFSAHVPDDLRLVVYGALEIKTGKAGALSEALQAVQRQPWCRRPEFRLTPLDPLRHVEEIDLLHYLEDPKNSSCPQPLQTAMAQLIHCRTKGHFQDTVALLEEAENGSWYALHDRLRAEQGESESGPEDPF